MQRRFPDIFFALENALKPERIYMVGGAVRAYVLGKPWPEDLDFATTAPPEVTIKALKNLNLTPNTKGKSFGVLKTHTPEHTIEIATLRREVYTPNSRYPKVTFITDLKQDSQRRDFTMNAIYLESNGTLHDFHGGIAHLKQGKVVFIGDPKVRLAEDPTRQARYERFKQLLS